MSKQTAEVHRRSTPNTNFVHKKHEDNGHQSNLMFHPLKKHMSQAELFTQWSALLVYLPVGVLAICIPGLLRKPFNIQSSRYADGLIRVTGMQLTVIAILYCTFSRVKPTISSLCIILATTLERTVYIGACIYVIYSQQLLPVPFLLVFAAADFGLSILTIYLWFSSSKVASVSNYFNCISQVISLKSSKLNYSSYAVQVLGFAQLIIASVFLVSPNLTNRTLQLNDLHGHARGLLSLGILASGAIGCIHLCSGGADCKAYNITAVFYRLFFSMPLVMVVALYQQIPFGLAGYLLGLDACSVIVISMTLCMDY